MTNIKQTDTIKCWQGRRNKRNHIYTLVFSSLLKSFHSTQWFHPKHLPKRKTNMSHNNCSCKDNSYYSATINNPSSYSQMNGSIIYLFSRTCFSMKKKQTFDNMINLKSIILMESLCNTWFYLYKISRKGKMISTKNHDYLWDGDRESYWLQTSTLEILCDKNVLKLDCGDGYTVVINCLCSCATLLLKGMLGHTLFLNKGFFKMDLILALWSL